MTTQNDLIHSAVANHIGPCDFYVLSCNAHNSYRDGQYCRAMGDALDAAGEAVLAVLADLRRQAEALPIFEPQIPAFHDVIDRDDVLRLLGGAQ